MNPHPYTTEPYLKGKQAAVDYNADPQGDMVGKYPNPYEYWSDDWQLWNLGWNHEITRSL